MAPHYKYKLVLTANSKSSINNDLFSGHKVLTLNTYYFKHTMWSQQCSEENPMCRCQRILGCQPVTIRSKNIRLIVKQVKFWDVCTSYSSYLCMCLASWCMNNLSDLTGLQQHTENTVCFIISKCCRKCCGGLRREPVSLACSDVSPDPKTELESTHMNWIAWEAYQRKCLLVNSVWIGSSLTAREMERHSFTVRLCNQLLK